MPLSGSAPSAAELVYAAGEFRASDPTPAASKEIFGSLPLAKAGGGTTGRSLAEQELELLPDGTLPATEADGLTEERYDGTLSRKSNDMTCDDLAGLGVMQEPVANEKTGARDELVGLLVPAMSDAGRLQQYS